jgi:hypothetical protein
MAHGQTYINEMILIDIVSERLYGNFSVDVGVCFEKF